MKLSTILLILLFAVTSSGQDQILISFESDWKYLDNGTNQGTAWRMPAYDDTSWVTGQAMLGYGESEVNTIVDFGGDPDNKFITTYFRHHFTINDLSIFKNFLLKLRKDDGAIVYVNGQDVMRSNFGQNTYDYLEEAYSTVSSEEEDIIWEELIDPSFFQTGENVIAVEVHQYDGESSDLIFDLELIGLDGNPELYRTPYLQKSTTSGVTIKWKTNIPTSSKVWFGQSVVNLSNIEESTDLTTNHEISIFDLETDAKYFYKVGYDDIAFIGGTADFFFHTNPEIGATDPLRIWVTGDAGTGKDEQINVRDSYLNFIGYDGKSDLWLMMGDNAYEHGREADYHMGLFMVYQEILRNTVSFTTSGNHDLLAETSAVNETGTFYDVFALPKDGECGGVASGTESYYSLDYGNVHIICLESTDLNRDSTAAMGTWLKSDLQNTNAEWLIAFWHFAPYTKVDHNSDDPDDWSGRAIEMRENMNPILEQYGVDLVLAGHSHGYERSYLIDGHYGFSNTLTPDMILDGTSGDLNETGAYVKPLNLTPHNGTVYVVCGNSGKVGSLDDEGPYQGPHPVMHETNTDFAGSVIIDITDGVLEGKFLNEQGLIQDCFHIVKETTNPIQKVSPVSIFDFHPNPATNKLNVTFVNDFNLENGQLEFFSADGRLIKQVPVVDSDKAEVISIDIHDLSAGIYTVRLLTNQKHITSKLLIVE